MTIFRVIKNINRQNQNSKNCVDIKKRIFKIEEQIVCVLLSSIFINRLKCHSWAYADISGTR